MKKEKWFTPDYYPGFRCKTDRCRHTCCSSWRIPVSKKEYQKLITMDCSKELDRAVQNAFVIPETVSDEVYRYVSFNWLGQCPIQKDGLCSLHMEKGESYLPKVCKLYPRSLKKIGLHLVASCSSSCERVVEMLYEMKGFGIIETEMEEEAQLFYEIGEEEAEQILLFQTLLKDQTTSLAESISDICRLINEKEFLHDLNSKEDPVKTSVGLLSRFKDQNNFFGEIADAVVQRYRDDAALFETDRKKFEEDFPEWMGFFERVINNSMVYECFPFVDKRADQTSVYKGLCLCYGLMRLVGIGYHALHDKKEDLIDAIAALFHLIDHTAFYYNAPLIVDNAAVFLKL
ncbi:MAG: flagellin lysine-N-methylase [Erysipelotrichaceae bacterium]|nr:flagellin lysine-N-methylase [Erysipelotrichaceae bacterium]